MSRRFLTTRGLFAFLALTAAAQAQEQLPSPNPEEPQVDACRAAGLLALKESSPSVKDVTIDVETVRVIKLDRKIGDEQIKSIVIGEVAIEKGKSSKPKSLICILGNKGRVLLSFFTDQ